MNDIVNNFEINNNYIENDHYRRYCEYDIYNDVIYFDYYFNRSLDNNILEILQKVKTIYFGPIFSFPIDNLPSNINKIVFCEDSIFNHKIDNLPNGLQYLILGNYFNQPIDLLPSSLKKLVLGRDFDKSLDNLPNGLEELFLGFSFSQHLNCLPDSIKKIVVFDLYIYRDELEKKYLDEKLRIINVKLIWSKN